MIYLATPYSHERAEIRERRFIEAAHVAGHLMSRGYIVYSPITHTHPIAVMCQLPTGFTFWRELDTHMIHLAEELWVVMLDGWMKSTGIKHEVELAEDRCIPIHFYHVSWALDGSVKAMTHFPNTEQLKCQLRTQK